jgi:hypothetical protein
MPPGNVLTKLAAAAFPDARAVAAGDAGLGSAAVFVTRGIGASTTGGPGSLSFDPATAGRSPG